MSRHAVLAFALAACGYPELPGGVGPDGPPNTGNDGAVCAAPASYGSPTPTSQQAAFIPSVDGSPAVIAYDAVLQNDDILFIDLLSFPGGRFANGFGPATIDIAGPEINFSTCSGCVIIGANCVNCRPEDDVGTARYFMATSGTLRVTAASQTTVSGMLTNVEFESVTIENGGAMPTLISRPVNDGCATKIVSASFSSSVVTP